MLANWFAALKYRYVIAILQQVSTVYLNNLKITI